MSIPTSLRSTPVRVPEPHDLGVRGNDIQAVVAVAYEGLEAFGAGGGEPGVAHDGSRDKMFEVPLLLPGGSKAVGSGYAFAGFVTEGGGCS